MRKQNFIKELNEYGRVPKRIIGRHTHSLINLTDKQLDIVIGLNNGDITLDEVYEKMKGKGK